MAIYGYTLTCPDCGHSAPAKDFSPSCADECFCPKCEAAFQFEADGGDDEQDDD